MTRSSNPEFTGKINPPQEVNAALARFKIMGLLVDEA
jgi:hypothetical protein